MKFNRDKTNWQKLTNTVNFVIGKSSSKWWWWFNCCNSDSDRVFDSFCKSKDKLSCFDNHHFLSDSDIFSPMFDYELL